MGCTNSKNSIKSQVPREKTKKVTFKSSADEFIVLNPKKIKEVYSFEDAISTNSHSEIINATHTITKQKRVIKIVNKNQNSNSNYAKIQNEIEILKKLSHPLVIKLFEYFEDEKKIYMVIEKCEGGDLFTEIIKKNFLSESLASVICKQLFSVVAYLHENGVAHRDIKPENILLEEKEDFFNIKLIDFGGSAEFSPFKKMTNLVGTPFYIAPEVLYSNYTEKCDVWSIGIIMYILLCGYPPFQGNSNQEICAKIKKGEFALNDSAWETISIQAKNLIKKLICPDDTRISANEALNDPWIKSHESFPKVTTQDFLTSFENLKSFNGLNRLRNSITVFINSQVVSLKESREIKALFTNIDVNGDGKLSKEEMIAGFNKIKSHYNIEEYIDQIMQKVDVDGNGFIDYNEFLNATISKEMLYSRQNVKNAFDLVDLDGSGKISANELKKVFGFGDFNDSTWNEIIARADKNYDGEMDFEEFYEFILALITESAN